MCVIDSFTNPRQLRRTLLTVLVLGAGVAGCAGQPYVDSRREAGQTTPVGTSTPDRVAICYSSRSTTPQTILRMADEECAKTGRTAKFDGQAQMVCALQAPTRAYFKCVDG